MAILLNQFYNKMVGEQQKVTADLSNGFNSMNLLASKNIVACFTETTHCASESDTIFDNIDKPMKDKVMKHKAFSGWCCINDKKHKFIYFCENRIYGSFTTEYEVDYKIRDSGYCCKKYKFNTLPQYMKNIIKSGMVFYEDAIKLYEQVENDFSKQELVITKDTKTEATKSDIKDLTIGDVKITQCK
jgi:hypothetical protein